MIYNIYYLRANQANFKKLISLAVRLGILSVDEGGIPFAPEGAYDYIGTIPTFSSTPDAEGVYAQIGVKQNVEGEDLIHANLALPYSLNAVGAAIAEEDTETAAIFTSIQEYFVTNPLVENVAAAPQNPARTFFDADAYYASLPPPAPPSTESLNNNGEGNEWTL